MRAREDIQLGHWGLIKAGQEIPDTYFDDRAKTIKTNFDQLREDGLLEEDPKAEIEVEPPAGPVEPPGPPAGEPASGDTHDDLSDLDDRSRPELMRLLRDSGGKVETTDSKDDLIAKIRKHAAK
jgi:hypothetical protein